MGDLESRLAKLRRNYAKTLPGSVEEARAALERTREGTESPDATWQIVHRMYGTAGSYGFDAVAETARSIELLLLPYRTGDTLPAEVAESASQLLEKLAAQASEAART